MDSIRNLAIKLLDDGHGINAAAWEALQELLHISGSDDIIDAVDAVDGRYYLDEGKFEATASDNVVFKLLIEDVDNGIDRLLEIKHYPSSVVICVEGCGLAEMETGCTDVVLVEFNSAVPRVMIWDDINSADPTDIKLDQALEARRID